MIDTLFYFMKIKRKQILSNVDRYLSELNYKIQKHEKTLDSALEINDSNESAYQQGRVSGLSEARNILKAVKALLEQKF